MPENKSTLSNSKNWPAQLTPDPKVGQSGNQAPLRTDPAMMETDSPEVRREFDKWRDENARQRTEKVAQRIKDWTGK